MPMKKQTARIVAVALALLLALPAAVAVPSLFASEKIPSGAILSPDGKWAAASRVRKEYESDQGVYERIEEALLFDAKKDKLLKTYDIVGINFSFCWSANSRFAAASFYGRTWGSFQIIDTQTRELHPELPSGAVYEALLAAGATFELNPFGSGYGVVSATEWLDGSRVLLAYAFLDSLDNTQTGTITYDVLSAELSDVRQNTPRGG